jgi:hypothetical protein
MSHINRPKTFPQAEPRSQALPAALKAAQSFNVFPYTKSFNKTRKLKIQL